MDIKNLIDSIINHSLDIRELATEGHAHGGKDDAVRYGGIWQLARLITEETETLKSRLEDADVIELPF